jgi:hypothetical protein
MKESPAKNCEISFGLSVTPSRDGHVDSALFKFCKFALATDKYKTAVVFYRSPNLKDHLILVDLLMRLSLSDRHLKKWNEIYDLANEHLPFRNELAHNPPTQVIHITAVLGGEPKFPVPPPQDWWEIKTDEKKLLNKPRKPLQAKREEVVAHINAIDVLLKKMWNLDKTLPKRPRRSFRPKPLPPVPIRAETSTRRASRP